MQVIQLIVGVGGDKAHLLCCYEAYVCPLLQHRSPAHPTTLWDAPVVRCLTCTLGSFLRVCGINGTYLRDDTAKYLCAYIKITASLEKKKKKKIKEFIRFDLHGWLLFKCIIAVIPNEFLILYLLFSEILLRD